MLIIANWKMHKTLPEARKFLETLTPLISGSQATVWIAPPFTLVREMAARGVVPIGGQNMHCDESGAFTGEISAQMLIEAGAQFVLLGHSERRHLFGESSAFVNNKVHRALVDGVQPVVCIGETLEQREQHKTEQILEEQLLTSLEGVSALDLAKIIIAYEPVWAIGTGKVAHPDDARQAHGFIRSILSRDWDTQSAKNIPILYGGSVKPDNAAELMAQEEIEGLLVGGAALEAEGFARIITLYQGISS